jgi:peptidoglycan/LPS O-acetylase OafA/YrhL
MAGLITLGLLRRPRLLLALAVAFAVTPALLEGLGLLPLVAQNGLFRLVFLGRGAILFAAFLGGCLLYVWRDAVPLDGRLFAAALAGIGLVHGLGPERWPLVETALSGLCLAYIAVAIGVTDFGGRIGPYKVDYSYGLYLYHCPILNAVYHLAPQIESVTILVLAAIGPTLLAAAASWHGLERPVLRARKRLGPIAGRTVAALHAVLSRKRLGFPRAHPWAGHRGGALIDTGSALHPQKVEDLLNP